MPKCPVETGASSAARLADLVFMISLDREASDTNQLARIMQIGAVLTDWKWRGGAINQQLSPGGSNGKYWRTIAVLRTLNNAKRCNIVALKLKNFCERLAVQGVLLKITLGEHCWIASE